MKLLYYPDTILEMPCSPVEDFTSIPALIDEMTVLMKEHKGLGLAANQVGKSLNLFIMKDSKGDIKEFINPKIIEEIDVVNMSEGCLSFPDIFLNISRPETVVVEFKNKEGEVRQIVANGLEARTILHEMDHLQGEVFISKVNRATRKAALSRLKRHK